MEPRIENLNSKKLVGKRRSMTLEANQTAELWKSFMQQHREITNRLNQNLFSIQVYKPTLDMKDFNLQTVFEKWAAVEVSDFNMMPDGMECFNLDGGLYAVFLHKGAAATGAKTFQYIFNTWLPASEYNIDTTRPHFELLGEKYKNNDPDSEEEIWIPVKLKE